MLRKKKLSRELYLALQEYIDRNYVEENREERRAPLFGMRREAKKASFLRPMTVKDSAPVEAPELCEMQMSAAPDYSDFLEDNQSALKERMNHLADTFQEYLLYLIESKGLTNTEVYKRALITKQLFSKIKINPQYHPDKATAMRLCVGTSLNLDETKDLLARAGYALSPCDKRDVIFSFFIEHEVHDMIEIDIALEEHGLPCFIE
ncbi:MAG: hypothetical protein IJ420_06505 [Lachnospiraceae bacterium]|nr:hypothetical protein [Lachnospiraceae bacterium]